MLCYTFVVLSVISIIPIKVISFNLNEKYSSIEDPPSTQAAAKAAAKAAKAAKAAAKAADSVKKVAAAKAADSVKKVAAAAARADSVKKVAAAAARADSVKKVAEIKILIDTNKDLELQLKEETKAKNAAYIIGIVSCIICIFLFFKRNQTLKINKDNIDEEKKLKDEAKKLKGEVEKLKGEVEKLKGDIAEKQREIEKLNSIVSSLNDKVNTIELYNRRINNTVDSNIPQPKLQKIFYLSTPSDNQTFDNSSRRDNFKTGASLYRLEIENTSNIAKFYIADQASSESTFFAYPQTTIDPVCERMNSIQNTTRVETVEPGKARLDNNIWVVIEKAKVRFI